MLFSRIQAYWGKVYSIVIYIYNYYFSKQYSKYNLSEMDKKIISKADWYHDFSMLGVKTYQPIIDGYVESQEDKQFIIFKYIKEAITMLKAEGNSNIKGLEMFCADAYFSMFALQNGAAHMIGVDLAEKSGEGDKRYSVLDQARVISKVLKLNDSFMPLKKDVFQIEGNYDLCICAGGLYHISDPYLLLKVISEHSRYLIIQTVISEENEDEKYFISPCPGWSWGCRFSYKWLLLTLSNIGWIIISSERNKLRANKRKCDKGSAYVLCVNSKCRNVV